MKALPRLFPLAVIALLITDIQPAAAQFAAPPGQPGARQQRPPALPGLAARRAPDPIPADESANLSQRPRYSMPLRAAIWPPRAMRSIAARTSMAATPLA